MTETKRAEATKKELRFEKKIDIAAVKSDKWRGRASKQVSRGKKRIAGS